MADLTDLFNAKTIPPCEGDNCIIQTAWNEGHRSLNLSSLTSEKPASEAHMKNLSKALYVPLYRWQFRLLRILPSPSLDEPLKCELLVANIIEGDKAGLQNNGCLVDYDAISYRWGKPEFTTNIQCNNMIVPTTRNLAEALYHFRRSVSDRYVWADAFCINQHDDREKSQQVNEIMFRIFEKAKNVLGWLGPSTTVNYKLFNLLSLSSLDIFGADRILHHGSACSIIIRNCQDLAKLLIRKNPWFSRLWIRQELSAARNLLMFCGAYQFDLFDITTLITLPEETSISSPVHNGRVFPSDVPISFTTLIADSMTTYLRAQMIDDKKDPTFTSPSIWIIALLRSLEFNVTLGVDMFYAIRNIVEKDAPPSRKVIPNIDYSNSWHSLYTSFMYKMILSGYLKVLDVFEDRTRQHAPDLPSWMTDLRSSHPRLFIAPSRSRTIPGKQPARTVYGDLVLKALRIGSVVGLVGEDDRLRLEEESKARGSNPVFCYGQWDQRFRPIPVGQTCDYDSLRSWSEVLSVLPRLSYTFFHADTQFVRARGSHVRSGPEKQKIIIIASKAVQPGDEIIRLFGSQSRFSYIIRRSSHGVTSSVKYIFLGVCNLWTESENQSDQGVPDDPCDVNIGLLEDFTLV